MSDKAKKYYWLKLKEDFFDDDTISYIEEQENGVLYVNFYLKLCLKSLKAEGKLIRLVGESFIPYDVKSLAKLTNTPVDTVRVAMELFRQIGLVKILETGEIYLSQMSEMIGSETDKAALMRRKRAEEKALGNNVTAMLPECYTEKEKETDKETDKEEEICVCETKSIQDTLDEIKASLESKQASKLTFDDWYSHYPRKEARQRAEKAWKKIKPDQSTIQHMIDAVEVMKTNDKWLKDNGQYIPLPATWLNDGRWEDEEAQPIKHTVHTIHLIDDDTVEDRIFRDTVRVTTEEV